MCGDLVSFPTSASKPRLVKPNSLRRASEQAVLSTDEEVGGVEGEGDVGGEANAAEAGGAASEAAGGAAVRVAGGAAKQAANEAAENAPGGNDLDWRLLDWSAPPSLRDRSEFSSGVITYTGPMFGGGMVMPYGAVAEHEHAVWAAHMGCVPLSKVKPTILSGGRRAARLPVPADLTIEADEDANGLVFAFSLPSGAYATSFLREFVRDDTALATRPPTDEGTEPTHVE